MEKTSVALCETTASSSYWELVGADHLVASEIRESPLEFEDAYPFDRIGTDSAIDNVFCFKSFNIGYMNSSVATPVFRAYLGTLMPELYSVQAVFEQVWVEWKMGGVRDELGKSFDRLSPTTKGLLDGSVSLETLYGDFMTPENIAAINAIHEANKRLSDREIVRVFLEGQAPVLASGVL